MENSEHDNEFISNSKCICVENEVIMQRFYIRFCMTRCIQLPYLFCYRYCLCFLGFLFYYILLYFFNF